MRKFFAYFFSIIFVTAALYGGIWHFYGTYFDRTIEINSPIPNFLILTKNNQVTLLDFWSPVVQQIQGDEGNLPDLTAQSVLMYDLTENKIIYEKDPKVR